MKLFHAYDGSVHPLDPDWHRRLTAAFGAMWPSPDDARAQAHALLERRQRFFWGRKQDDLLTAQDREFIQCCDAIWNMNRSVWRLEGRDPYSLRWASNHPLTIDKLKFTDCYPNTCECALRYMWRLDEHEAVRVHHPWAMMRRCDRHAHLEDVAECQQAVFTFCRAVNRDWQWEQNAA
jgi:hypothetical protein